MVSKRGKVQVVDQPFIKYEGLNQIWCWFVGFLSFFVLFSPLQLNLKVYGMQVDTWTNFTRSLLLRHACVDANTLTLWHAPGFPCLL